MFVALEMISGWPNATSDGKEMRVPPPATELTAPAAMPAKKRPAKPIRSLIEVTRLYPTCNCNTRERAEIVPQASIRPLCSENRIPGVEASTSAWNLFDAKTLKNALKCGFLILFSVKKS